MFLFYSNVTPKRGERGFSIYFTACDMLSDAIDQILDMAFTDYRCHNRHSQFLSAELFTEYKM